MLKIALILVILTGGVAGAVAVVYTSGPLSDSDAREPHAASPTTQAPPEPVVSTLERALPPTGRFFPDSAATDGSGNLYVTDFYNRKVYLLGTTGGLQVLAGSGEEGLADGPGLAAQFMGPTGIAIDSAGNVYVADSPAHRIRRIDRSGNVSTWAGGGEPGLGNGAYRDGPKLDARFSLPAQLAFDHNGNLIVTDKDNDRIRSISREGIVSTIAGVGSKGTPSAGRPLGGPVGLAVGPDGSIYFTEHRTNSVRRLSPTGEVETLFQGVPAAVTGDRSALSKGGGLNFPSGMAVVGSGRLIISDTQANRILILEPGAQPAVLAGTGVPGFADGPGRAAQFASPVGVVAISGTEFIIADKGNGRLRSIQLP